jgi:hypothetical protein
MRNILSLIAILLVSVVLSACSKTSNPVTTPGSEMSMGTETPGTVSIGNGVDSSKTDTRGVFGMWKVHVDPVALTAEIIPARKAQAIGLIVDADLSQFLFVNPCSDCLMIPKVFIDGYGNLGLEVRMKHPFPNAASRPDLHGFDVRAIFITTQDEPSIYPDIKVMRPGAVEEDAQAQNQYGSLQNADGFTSHYDELVTDERYFIGGTDIPGNLNPYLRFFENYSDATFDPSVPTGHNVMPTGSPVYSRTAIFGAELEFGFDCYIVADVAYGQSAKFANRNNPQYYLPAFNRTEPWRVEYWLENNNLSFMDPTSTAELVVQVFDWQHNAVVDPNYPDPANLGGIPESSKVAQVELSIPGYQDALIIQPAPTGGTGTPSDPLVYRLTITNVNGAGGVQIGLLAVRDELYNQTGRVPIPPSPAGFPYETLDILDYAYYTYVDVNTPFAFMIGGSNYNVKNEMWVPYDDLFAEDTWYGLSTSLKPTFFMDPSHRKFQYDWDYNYDGLDFHVDGSGLPSPSLEYTKGGKTDVGLRVTTNSVPPREYIYTVPVWADGMNYHDTAQFSGATENTTSTNTKHAVASTADNFYFAYSHESGGQRDIYLGIVDIDGNITTRQVTNTLEPDSDPAICVIASGAHEGIYIVYNEWDGANNYLYSNYGNLDGSGFLAVNRQRVTLAAAAYELNPVILSFDGALHVYYERNAVFVAYIYGAHSDDYGQTWSDDGWLVDNTSNGQVYPTAVYSYDTMYLIWEDFVDYANSDTDLWIAESSDGVTFTTMVDISAKRGLYREEYPSASYSSGQIAIAYLMSPQGDTKKIVNVKVLDVNNLSVADTPINFHTSGNITHTAPAIVATASGEYNLAFGSYNIGSQVLSHTILELHSQEYPGQYSVTEIYDEEVGTAITSDAAQTFPGITSRRPLPNVADNFTIWRQFSDGIVLSPTTPQRYFGKVDYMNFITERSYSLY